MKVWKPKPDSRSFPSIKDEGEYFRWEEDWVVALHAYGFGKIVDQDYHPVTEDEIQDYYNQNQWV